MSDVYFKYMHQRLGVDAMDPKGVGLRHLDISNKELSDANDYDEKKQIRLALRQLRQREKERESGRDAGLVNGRAIIRSQSFASQNYSPKQNGQIVRESGDRPIIGRRSSVHDIRTRDHFFEDTSKNCSTGSTVNNSRIGSCEIGQNGYSNSKTNGSVDSVNSLVRKEVVNKNSFVKKEEKDSKVENLQATNNSSVSVLDKKPPSIPGEQRRSSRPEISDNSSSSKSSVNHVTSSSISSRSHPFLSSKSTGDLFHRNNKQSNDSLVVAPLGRSHSVVAAHFDKTVEDDRDNNTHKQWLEGKKRSSSVPNIDREKLLSTLDMEAAFSELLSAVDESGDRQSDNDLIEDDTITEDMEESTGDLASSSVGQKTATEQPSLSEKSEDTSFNDATEKQQAQVTENEDTVDSASVTTTKALTRPSLSLTPTPSDKKSAISIIEDDDGSITVQSVSHKDQGDHTVLEKTTLRRTESKTEEEMKDTIIESKITSPGGSDHYTKDVIKTRRKITSRGSDYFSRSTYNIRKKKNMDGNEIEERDVSLETDNFSVTKGESWGDRTEGVIKVHRAANQFPSSIPEGQESKSRESLTSESDSKPPSTAIHSKMDVSKTSSGYGSVSGSDEDDKEEHLQLTTHGRPSGCPEIKSALKDVITLEGSTAVLECTVTCNPLPTVAWYKGKKSLVSSSQYEPKFDSLTGKASLVILNTSTTNGGEYKCVFRNPMGEAETNARLTVRCRASRKPTFNGSLKDTTVTEGQSVSLECKVIDATQIAWYKDGIIQRNSSDFKQTFDGSVAKLEIEEIFLDDQGEYSCIAKNDKGEAKTSCKIKVRECDTGEGDVVPMFLTRPESKIYSHGDTIILECDVIGSPKPTLTWCRDGDKLCSNSKLKMFYDGRVALLKISQATMQESGKYEVFAENSSGKVKVDALIVVKDKQGPPAILQSLTDATTTCGKPLVLQCDIRGSPIPVVLWRKDGRMIGNTSDFKQTYQNNIAKLEIKDVFKQDGGCYECVARNSFGAVTSSCSITVQGENSSNTENTNKRTDWVVGRATESSVVEQSSLAKSKDTSIKRSESVRVTSKYSPQNRFQQDFKVGGDDAAHTEKTPNKNEKVNSANVTSEDTSLKNTSEKSVGGNTESKAKNKFSLDDQSAKSAKNDPPWKNVTLRRAESARVPSYNRSKPLTWKRDEAKEKADDKTKEVKVESSAEAEKEKPAGWRSVTLDKKDEIVGSPSENDRFVAKTQVNLRRSESARVGSANQNIIAKFLQNAQQRDKHDDVKDSAIVDKSHGIPEISRLKSDHESVVPKSQNATPDSKEANKDEKDTKLNRSQSLRLLFEKNGSANAQNEKKETPVASFLARKDLGLRRTSSLKMLPGEREAGSYRSKKSESGVFLDLAPPKGNGSGDSVSSRKQAWENSSANSTMSSYDAIDDEEELHKILSNTDNFEERKKIRGRMREIREKKQKESEQRRLQREKETEDIIRKRHEQAEIEKQRKMKEFDKMAKEATADRERILQKSEDLLRDKLRIADEGKQRQLAAYDKLAQKDETKSVTITKTPGGGTRTTVITESKTSTGFGGTAYGKPTAAKPAGVQGAKAMFKQMDSSSPSSAPNFTVGGGRGGGGRGGGGRGLMRSPSAIKTMLLEWCKAMTREYEGVEVTNFSSCWNNGMAFCALIHHFYPEAFDFSTLDPKKRRYNFTLAFDTAEKYGDIAPLLDVEDMVRMQKPDWKCVFTYVQSLYRKLHTHELNKA